MELLWSESDFSKSIKDSLGYVDADLSFRRMHSALRAATSEMVDLIGEAAYQDVVDKKDGEVRTAVEYCILLKAVIIYAPTSDIAITNNGRRLRVDNHEQLPYQIRLDSHDDEQEKLYYTHLNLLLVLLHKKGIAINFEKYKFSDLLVNSLQKFEQHFNINGSFLLFLKLLPALRECEELELVPRIGEVPETLFTLNMRNIAEKVCVYYALAWGLRRLNTQLFPDGVFQFVKNTGGNTRKPNDKLQYLETAMVFDSDFRKYILSLEGLAAKATAVKPDIFADRIIIDSGIYSGDNFIDT